MAWTTGVAVVLGAVNSALINELHGGWPWWLAAIVVTALGAVLAGWLAIVETAQPHKDLDNRKDNDPEPLPSAADARISDHPADTVSPVAPVRNGSFKLETLAPVTSAAPGLAVGPMQQLRTTLERHADELLPKPELTIPVVYHEPDGDFSCIAAVYRKIHNGRMSIVGAAGSGKSTLGWKLAHDLLTDAGAGDAVPVVLSVTSWNAWKASFEGWLTDQVAELAPEAEKLVSSGMVLPILDGFDQVDDQLRSQMLYRLSTEPAVALPMVTICRTERLRRANAGEHSTPLLGATVLAIDPVPLEDSKRYLLGAVCANKYRSDEWRTVFSHVQAHDGCRLGEALADPAVLSEARRLRNIHDYRSGGLLGRGVCLDVEAIRGRILGQPIDKLCDNDWRHARRWMETIAARMVCYDESSRLYLFDPNEQLGFPTPIFWTLMMAYAVLPVAIVVHAAGPLPTAAVAALAVVSFVLVLVAQGGEPDTRPAPRTTMRCLRAEAGRRVRNYVALCLAVGAAGVTYPHIGHWTIAVYAVGGTVLVKTPEDGLTRHLGPVADWTSRRLGAAVVGVAAGVVAEIVLLTASGRPIFVWAGLLYGLAVGLPVAANAAVLRGRRGELRDGLFATGPAVGFAAASIVAPIAASAAAVTGYGRLHEPGLWVAALHVAAFAAAVALVVILRSTWIQILAKRVVDDFRGQLPLTLLRFLDDAEQRGVLRRRGGRYEFRFDEVRTYLLAEIEAQSG
jgi:hypothetical protein